MNIKPIHSDDDLHAAFTRLERVFQAQEGTPEADEMEILVTLIEVSPSSRIDEIPTSRVMASSKR
jgi:HTH-type transcriptional regulator/antitoxin HigA